MKLISAWFHVEQNINEKSIAGALRDLNTALGTRVRINRPYEWRDGKVRPSEKIQRYMRIVVARHALDLAGIPLARTPSDNEITTLIDMLSIKS